MHMIFRVKKNTQSGVKGVQWSEKGSKWVAKIRYAKELSSRSLFKIGGCRCRQSRRREIHP